MYVLKIDLPTGVAYFTGKKRVVQGSESPGLTDLPDLAKQFEDENEAKKFCKMLIKRYDMEFYYSTLGAEEQDFTAEDEIDADIDVDFVVDLPEEIEAEIEAESIVHAEAAGQSDDDEFSFGSKSAE